MIHIAERRILWWRTDVEASRAVACQSLHGCRAGLLGVKIGNELGRVQEIERQEAERKNRTEDCSCLLKITLNSK
jgi:hypothetical protein